jgi:hypothetical protein
MLTQLSCFDTREQAIEARDWKALQVHGAFVKLNALQELNS